MRPLALTLGLAAFGSALANPLASATPAQAVREGAVAEHAAARHYCYVRLAQAPADEWLVTLGACPATGASVRADVYAWQSDFASRRLGRVFPRLGFARLTPTLETTR